MRTLFIVLILLALSQSDCKYSCIGINGKAVSWYLMHLYPDSKTENSEGLTFGYIDSSMSSIKTFSTAEHETPVIYTLNAVIDKLETSSDKSNVAFWNDQTSLGTHSHRAHSKGGFAFDKQGGFIIDHSLPRFPKVDEEGDIYSTFEDNIGVHAQHFYCTNLTSSDFSEMAPVITSAKPYVMYSNHKEDKVNAKPNEHISQIMANDFDRMKKSVDVTVKYYGREIAFFGKNKVDKELPWEKRIPKYFNSKFYIFTWVRSGSIPSDCKGKGPVNVTEVKFDKFTYPVTNNHSKWAVDQNGQNICFGDLNYEESQRNRGGIIVCFENESIAKVFRKAIQATDCPKKSFLSWLVDW